MSDPTDTDTLCRVLQPTIDIPIDGPVIYLTRDAPSDGSRAPVEVWVTRPLRMTSRGTVWVGNARDLRRVGYLGAYTDECIRERFALVPGPDECIVLDNPKVN